MQRVHIVGDGVAARCCAHLLAQAGFLISFEKTERPRVPAILLGETSQRLIADIFGRDDLFQGASQIRKRVVAWGGAPPVELEHAAVVVSEEELLGRLGAIEETVPGQPDWIIRASPGGVEHRFGSRMAVAFAVEHADRTACWIESLDDGWLFLNSGWLLAVGAQPNDLLGRSKRIAPQITAVQPASGRFPSSPKMIEPLGGDGWIACGSAAMAFDPLCGDGTAHAVREAILASAAIRAAANEDARPLLAHYEARLTAGFERHLAECHKFYSSGGNGPWWTGETVAAARGIDWCRQKLESHGPFRYRLSGLELFRID